MKRREAYVFWNAGICHVVEYPSQKRICLSKHFRRATRRARNLGYDVTVYCSWMVKPPRDAMRKGFGGYVLPRKKL